MNYEGFISVSSCRIDLNSFLLLQHMPNDKQCCFILISSNHYNKYNTQKVDQ